MTDSNSNHQPRQHKASLTVLVASTLGASLSAVPKSQEAQGEHPDVPATISREEESFNRQRSPERRASSPLASYPTSGKTATDSSNLDSGSRKRISLTRLHFNSKKSAGSESSRGEALTKQESFSTSPPAAGVSMAKAAARQVSTASETSLAGEHDQ